jgi:hypothetical protein
MYIFCKSICVEQKIKQLMAIIKCTQTCKWAFSFKLLLEWNTKSNIQISRFISFWVGCNKLITTRWVVDIIFSIHDTKKKQPSLNISSSQNHAYKIWRFKNSTLQLLCVRGLKFEMILTILVFISVPRSTKLGFLG